MYQIEAVNESQWSWYKVVCYMVLDETREPLCKTSINLMFIVSIQERFWNVANKQTDQNVLSNVLVTCFDQLVSIGNSKISCDCLRDRQPYLFYQG